MVFGANAHHFVGKQRLVHNAALRRRFRHNRQIGAVGEQQPHRIGLKAGHNIQLHLRPQRAEGIHGGHQPVKTGVALYRHAQFTRFALDNLRHIALSRGQQRHKLARQLQQPLTGGGKADGIGFALKQRRVVMLL